jgi:hypothetical protein
MTERWQSIFDTEPETEDDQYDEPEPVSDWEDGFES